MDKNPKAYQVLAVGSCLKGLKTKTNGKLISIDSLRH